MGSLNTVSHPNSKAAHAFISIIPEGVREGLSLTQSSFTLAITFKLLWKKKQNQNHLLHQTDAPTHAQRTALQTGITAGYFLSCIPVVALGSHLYKQSPQIFFKMLKRSNRYGEKMQFITKPWFVHSFYNMAQVYRKHSTIRNIQFHFKNLRKQLLISTRNTGKMFESLSFQRKNTKETSKFQLYIFIR